MGMGDSQQAAMDDLRAGISVLEECLVEEGKPTADLTLGISFVVVDSHP